MDHFYRALLSTRLITSFAFCLGFIIQVNAQVSVTCPGDITQPNDLGECGAVVNYTAPEGTGSGTNITTELTQGLPPGSEFPVGVTQITYTVTNDEGDSDDCSFFIIVEDQEDPTFDCPDDIIVDADANDCSAVVFFDIPDAFDNCFVADVFQFGGLPSGSAFPVGENSVDFQAIDAEGNVAFCRVVIFVNDVSDPVITCPDDITVEVTDDCEAVVNYTAPVGSDPCSATETNLTGGLGSGATFPIGTTTEEYTVTDAAGNSATCTFEVNVVDAAPPVITCPDDITVTADPGDCDAVVTFPDPVTSDNCPGETFEQTAGPASGEVFPAGETTVTFTATDAAGNTSECSFTVTVNEDEDPEITCPDNITADTDPGECTAVVSYTPPEGTDNCPGAVTELTSGIGSGGTFPIGTTVETYTVTDAAGNTAECTFEVTVEDNEAPEIECPENLEASADPGTCEATVNFAAPEFTDNCPGGSITQTDGPVSGSAFPVGATEIEFTATDDAGNTSVCTFSVVVLDEEDPEIDCPDDVEITLPDGECEGEITYDIPTATDNCPGVSVSLTEGPASGETAEAGVYTVTYEATDASGNTAECSFTVTLIETTEPEFDCPDDINAGTDEDSCDAVVTFDTPTATDLCSEVTVTQTGGPASGSTFPEGSTEVEFTATDEFGNTAVCTFNIIVSDDTPPAIDCPEEVQAVAAPGTCEATVTFDAPEFTDNCPGGSIAQTDGPASGSTFPVGATEIEFTATDEAGNASVCTFSVVVLDEEDPEITCPEDVEITLPEGVCDGEITYDIPTATDNCPGVNVSLTEGPASGETVEAGVYTVTYEATDASGNTAECSFTVTLIETNEPEFDCPDDITVAADEGSCDAVVTFDAPTATDPCSEVTVTQTAGPASGSTFPAGSTEIEFTAEDEFGNLSVCTFNVIVTTDAPPVITCPENITTANDPGDCGATVSYPAPDTDGCGDITTEVIEGPASGDFFPVGTTTVTLLATDESGNTAECSFTVTVTDEEAPELTCPSDINITLDGTCEAEVNFPPASAVDNCEVVSTEQTEGIAPGELFPVGVTTVTYEATDAAGNIGTCSFTVTITESTPPEITCPDDIVTDNDPGECGAVVNYPVPEGSDNCPGAVTELTEGPESGDFFPVGTTTVTYTVTDLSGNTADCSFSVTVNDTEPPVFECPESPVTADTDPGECGTFLTYDLPDVADNCDGSLTAVLVSGPNSGDFVPVGAVELIFEATDAAGNSATCTIEVTVEDNEAPEITCTDDILIDAASGDCDATVTYDDPTATDNCGIADIELTAGLASGSAFPAGETTVTFTATDVNGNTAECSFTVTVTEDVPPVITCPDDIAVNNDPGACSAIVNYDLPEAEDACGDVSLALIEGPASGAEFPLGATEVTFEATDLSGNTVQCTFTVTVNDAEPPEFLACPDDLNLANDTGECGAVYSFDLPEASDNCTETVTVTQTAGPDSGSLLLLGETVFTFTAEDEFGNTSECTYTVTVTDEEAPVFTACPDDLVIAVGEDGCEAEIIYDTPLAEDNCSAEVTLTEGPESGSGAGPGTYAVVFEATDPSGNTAACSFTVNVIDTIPPVFDCPDTLQSCEMIVNFDFPEASDNCEVVEVVQTGGPESGTSFPLGFSEVSFEAVDASGNTAECTFVIERLVTAPRADAGNDRNICDATSFFLNGNDPGDALGTWILESGFGIIADENDPNTEIEGLEVGQNVFVWFIDPLNGCDFETDTVTITVEEGVTVNAGEDELIFAGGSVQLFATGLPPGGNFLWEPEEGLSCTACADPTASPEETTQYLVTYTSPLGCSVSDSLIVRVFRELPNTITPDNDGVNDVWNIPGIDQYPNAVVAIYNRWGNEVFSSTGYNEPWDGRRNGEDLPAGSYYYIIDYNTEGKENLNGTVNIIR